MRFAAGAAITKRLILSLSKDEALCLRTARAGLQIASGVITIEPQGHSAAQTPQPLQKS